MKSFLIILMAGSLLAGCQNQGQPGQRVLWDSHGKLPDPNARVFWDTKGKMRSNERKIWVDETGTEVVR